MKKPRNRIYPTGPDHPRWQGGERQKNCQQCGDRFSQKPTEAASSFRKRKFCSRECGWKGQVFCRGAAHYAWRDDARRKSRGGPYRKWTLAVFNRDKATCQCCGAAEIELHAHHIRPYKDFPDLRFEIANGITLCFKCHWALHAALNEKAVNSGNIPPGKAGDNPEPSMRGNLHEGVTTRGRAFRRWIGECSWCKSTISKPLSDAKGKAALFCNGSCRSKWIRAKHSTKAVISSTSAAPERDDIV